ncbi:MAG TPA: DUF418 domain-containing protein [Gemmatimonadaceae bacterium]|jgi:uncharacterized protein|nr:DUF418 domain-containing protein [Gemmatimonadaceae bacterium]
MLATTRVSGPLAARRPASAAAPAAPNDRLHALDQIRGLALVFMVLVHFHQLVRLESTGWQGLIGWAVWVGVEQKAWGAFAMLFGAGFALLLRRLEARGARVTPIFVRRLAALFAIGWLVESVIGFHILTTYAVCGVIALAIRRWSTRALFRMVIVSAMFPPALNAVMGLVMHFTHRTFPLLERWWWLVPDESLPLLLLGFLAVRVGVVDDPLRHVRLIRGWMLFGFAAWAVSWLVLFHVPRPPQYLMGAYWAERTLIGLVKDQWLCITYVGGALLLLAKRPGLAARMRPIGAAGRLALTNYVLQAVTIWYLAKPLGIKLHEAEYVAAWLVLVAVIVPFSTLWLARFRFGPLEWLWRMFTYAKREPLRRADDGPVALAVAS